MSLPLAYYTAAFLFAALLTLVRLVKGPTPQDRMVALDTSGTILVGVLVLLSIQFNKSYLIDVAIMYALLTFIATGALSKYLRGRL